MNWDNMDAMKTDTEHAMEMIGKRLYKYAPHITLIQEIIGNANDEFQSNEVSDPTITIDFQENSDGYYIIFNNNAPPIPKHFFVEDYQTFFKSSKSSKEGGIGFVGVGAKQFLTSQNGRELVTITGDKKDEILASVWKYQEGIGVRVGVTPKMPFDDIMGSKKINHTYGTTFVASLTKEEYDELKEVIIQNIHHWWNYGLLANRFKIFVSGEEVLPWIPNENQKHLRNFQIAGKKIDCIFWITDDELVEEADLQNIVWIVADKRIVHKKLETSGRVIKNFGKRIFCYVDVSKLLKGYVTMSKEDFEDSKLVKQVKNRTVEEFWKFIVDNDLVKENLNETTKNVELEMLMRKFNEALQSEKFKNWNPFLAKKTRIVPVLNSDGDESLSESDGYQKTEENASNGGEGGIIGEQDGKGHSFDKSGKEKGEKKVRQSKGFDMGEIDVPEDERESWIDYPSKSLLINIGHPFFVKNREPLSLREFNKCRVIVDALVRHQIENGVEDIQEVLDESRNLLHEVFS